MFEWLLSLKHLTEIELVIDEDWRSKKWTHNHKYVPSMPLEELSIISEK